MFERFTPAARQVVVRGQEEARAFGHPWLGTEHLLLGVLAEPQAPGVSVLTDLGVNLDTARVALSQLVGRGGLLSPGSGDRDAEALRTLGIDLDEVRSRWRRASRVAHSTTLSARERGAGGRGAAADANRQM